QRRIQECQSALQRYVRSHQRKRGHRETEQRALVQRRCPPPAEAGGGLSPRLWGRPLGRPIIPRGRPIIPRGRPIIPRGRPIIPCISQNYRVYWVAWLVYK